MKKRKFVVIGLGNFGFHIAKSLTSKGHEVLAVDRDPHVVQEIKDHVSQAVIADASDKETLEAIGANDADVAILSLGGNVLASILITLFLREFGVPEIVVKATTEDHRKILEKIGATKVFFVEREMAERLSEILSNPSVWELMHLSPGYSIVEMEPPQSFIGKTLKDLDLRKKYHVQVVAIKELVPERTIVVPPADFTIKDSDILVVLGKDEDIERVQKL